MVSSPKGISLISPGDRIAQLLILPSKHAAFPLRNNVRGSKGFGPSGGPQAWINLDMVNRPLTTLSVEGRKFTGLLDTGADRSIVNLSDWLKSWPLQQSCQTLRGLGYAQDPQCSARFLKRTDDEGHEGAFQPFVMQLPISLWGQDILQMMGIRMVSDTEYSPQSQRNMQAMGYKQGKGLGKKLPKHC
ncbi:endogenous retrovirus group K member 21 Pro protein-like [Nannospalax galili]|uniref:endogenous retrovirus group K member 21 Pro protein-like n=1 Tax=Nannospalax galili TaxID=1026970 RepID=UPI00081A2645|nr:endogenous retrovirus group K member 21 Pro protein-like [Nannospalax galili]